LRTAASGETSMTDFLTALESILARHPHQQDALLPILHDLQDALGFIPPAVLPPLAQALNLSHAEVLGVVSFYAHFRTTPPAAHTIHICQAEACQSRGARELTAHAEAHLGCKLGEQTESVGLQAAYCLGLCATAPAIQIDETLHACVCIAKFDTLIAEVLP
jgi:formate dehydrogenase subunit gamma